MAAIEGQHFPSRPLARIVARGMARNGIEIATTTGERTMLRPLGGEVSGRLSGRILPNLAGEWRLRGPRGEAGEQIEGLIGLETDEGQTILFRYIGRRAARYGKTWRLGATFEAPGESHGWLNDIVAAGIVEEIDGDFVFHLHQLLPATMPVDDPVIGIEPLYRMQARDSVGKRHTIEGAVGRRYFSVAEHGCRTHGRIEAEWPEGFSWGIHRLGSVHGVLPVQIDMRATMRTDDGAGILQHYIGVTPARQQGDDPDPERSWRTVAVFEAPHDGPHAWVNDVVALGIGWQAENEANYAYYAMR